MGQAPHAPRGAGRAPAAANVGGMGIAARRTTDQQTSASEGPATQTVQRRCDGCGRLPLIGESVAHYKSGAMRCDLCRSLHVHEDPVSEVRVNHAPDGPQSRVRVIRRLPT